MNFNYLENNIPIPEEEMNVLKTFDKEYSFEEDIQERGRDAVLKGLNEVSKYFDFEEAKLAATKGLKMAQVINPDVPIKPFPIVFLYNPFHGDAKSLYGQGCGINIAALKNKRYGEEPQREKIVSFTAHEATHTFLEQLGVRPKPGNRTNKKCSFDFIWEEGLTTYIEPTHYLPHDDVEADGAFWVDIINRWYKAQTPEEDKQIYEEVVNRHSFKTWYHYMYYNEPIPINLELSEKNFQTMLMKRNGIGYHVGSYLWKRELEKGKTLKELVMAGSGQMEEWMKELDIYSESSSTPKP